MATRPTVDLDWAENDVVDATSGQNNKVEPPTAWKNNGWSYQEKPPRNYDNYHKWNTGQWVKYLDTIAVRPATYFVAATNAAAETKLHADAVCDGTDDQTEIYAAITSVAATGGKVLLSEGTFTVSGVITISGDVHLQGMGIGATTIKIKDADTGSYTIVDVNSIGNVTVSDLTIDGNSGSATGANTGLKISACAGCLAERLEIKDTSRNVTGGETMDISGGSRIFVRGCLLSGADTSGIDCSVSTVFIEGCQISSCGGTGIICGNSYIAIGGCRIDANETHGIVASDYTRIVNCIIASNAISGVKLDGDYAILAGCDVVSNSVDPVTGGFQAITIDGGGNTVTGCVVANNGGRGIDLEAGAYECLVTDCQVYSNSQKTDDTSAGIYVTSGASANTISDNKIRRGVGAKQQKYGIDLEFVTSGTEQNYVYGNDVVTGGKSGTIWLGSPVTGSARTIPRWVGSGAAANLADDVTIANRLT